MNKPSKGARFYTRTTSGQRAWSSASSGLPAHYRRILSLIAKPTPADRVCTGMLEHPARQVQAWLDELETLCFVELELRDGGHRAPPTHQKAAQSR